MSYFLILAVAATGYFLVRQRKMKATTIISSQATKSARESGFACVALKTGTSCCRAARRSANVSQLAGDAPILPLAGCDRSVCNCSYVKAADRRQVDGRRTADFGIQPIMYAGVEQRDSARDRRLTH